MSHPADANVPSWTTDLNPAEFFREKIVDAQQRQKIKLTENVEYYLVNLLCEFVRLDDRVESDCLVFMLKKALESPPGERVLLFKRLGDTALYFSGFFQEYFNRKCFDVSYYVTMGESAYGQLSSMMRRKTAYEATMSKIYGEMSTNFSQAVDVLMDVSEHTSLASNVRNTLSVYDAWISTASAKLERDLFARGIHPVRVPKSTKH